ncbi:MAG TPA: PQQ-dependent sugar dehydrogenase [Anaerolineales bacterium]|nr:PQQ-dependent sugar dehydrogenase [Anaerolineales bacterium]
MKRLSILLLILPILACGGLAAPVSPTNTPPAPLTVDFTPQTDAPPAPDSPTAPSVLDPAVNAGSIPNAGEYEWKEIASGLNRPVDVQSANDGSGRLFIIEKYGLIRIIENGQLLDVPFLNIDARVDDRGNEMGLLGLVFHPIYKENGYFYINYTGDGGHTRISRFQASGNVADPNSETVLLLIKQPYANHNGGGLDFGPDGYLYAGLGDGGSQGDPSKNGQNTTVMLAKILRIDVNNGDPYSVPPDNPFGNEVWAYGLRNPWRISFDSATGDLWIGDVGQGQWEEIDYLPAGAQGGANFGWPIMEGNHDYDGTAQPGLLLPAVEYSHSEGGCSVTGGYVYRGSMPEWQGIYIYGDYCTGFVWGLIPSADGFQSQLLFQTGMTITSFGRDESGEIYLASDYGGIYLLAKK